MPFFYLNNVPSIRDLPFRLMSFYQINPIFPSLNTLQSSILLWHIKNKNFYCANLYVQVYCIYLNKKSMSHPRYRHIHDYLLAHIQKGDFQPGDYLPSENELCRSFSITRTTARKALDELQKAGFIERQHGKGSMVRERRTSLGLLNVKGFSEAVGKNVTTTFLQHPSIKTWNPALPIPPAAEELSMPCIHFERLRSVGSEPVMVENNWFPVSAVSGFTSLSFIEESFFKTLSRYYGIEIVGSEQLIWSIEAESHVSDLLKVVTGSPVLKIALCFHTNQPHFHIYSELLCNTRKYPIGNRYFL
jgi:DNA-binding GntR family transcriptional regulator